MNNAVYFDDVSPYNVKNERGSGDGHPAAECLELVIFRNMTN